MVSRSHVVDSNVHELRALRDMTAGELHLEYELVEANVEQGIVALRAIMSELHIRSSSDGNR